jgi:hypothetical protein
VKEVVKDLKNLVANRLFLIFYRRITDFGRYLILISL